MENKDFTGVLNEWRYIQEQYGGELPLTVLLYNCNNRVSGKIMGVRIVADSSGTRAELEFVHDGKQEATTLVVSQDSVWIVKDGKSATGRRVFTRPFS